jgi:hypothetical protein
MTRDDILDFSSPFGSVGTADPVGFPCFRCSGLAITLGGTLNLTGNSAAWVIEAARKLEALGSLHCGWDSYGGLPLTPTAKELTLRVLDWLGQNELPIPLVILGSSGDVHLEWRKKGRELEVELGGNRGIAFAKVHSTGEVEEGTEAVAMKDRLRNLSQWLMNG